MRASSHTLEGIWPVPIICPDAPRKGHQSSQTNSRRPWSQSIQTGIKLQEIPQKLENTRRKAIESLRETIYVYSVYVYWLSIRFVTNLLYSLWTSTVYACPSTTELPVLYYYPRPASKTHPPKDCLSTAGKDQEEASSDIFLLRRGSNTSSWIHRHHDHDDDDHHHHHRHHEISSNKYQLQKKIKHIDFSCPFTFNPHEAFYFKWTLPNTSGPYWAHLKLGSIGLEMSRFKHCRAPSQCKYANTKMMNDVHIAHLH